MKTARELVEKHLKECNDIYVAASKASEEYANQFKQTEQPQKLLPFNLERALSGDEVVTRDGRKVSEIHYFKSAEREFPLYAVIDGHVFSFKEDGHHSSTPFYNHDNDLFMASRQVTKWVNVYKENEHILVGYCTYDTEQEAKDDYKQIKFYIATAPITFSI